MKTFAAPILIPLMLLSLFNISEANPTLSAKPPAPKRWSCTASDGMGGFGFGTAPTRAEAEATAVSNCQLRSHGACSQVMCSSLR